MRQNERQATVRSHAEGLSIAPQFLRAAIIASCVASSASARLAPMAISMTTVLLYRSR
jgi:hypothetical protein